METKSYGASTVVNPTFYYSSSRDTCIASIRTIYISADAGYTDIEVIDALTGSSLMYCFQGKPATTIDVPLVNCINFINTLIE